MMSADGTSRHVFAQEMEENFKKMEEQEGMSLSMHLDEDEDMEEDIEWYEPVGTLPRLI